MAEDRFKRYKSNNDLPREITQDDNNTSVNMGRRRERASLSFDFENRPAESRSNRRRLTDAEAVEIRKALVDAERRTTQNQPVITDSMIRAAEEEKHLKKYGLPDEYSWSDQPPKHAAHEPEPQSSGLPADIEIPVPAEETPAAESNRIETGGLGRSLKRWFSERQEIARAARNAAEERRQQLQREDEAIKAARDAEKAARVEAEEREKAARRAEKAAKAEAEARERAARIEAEARERAEKEAEAAALAAAEAAARAEAEARERAEREAEAAAKAKLEAEAAAKEAEAKAKIEEEARTKEIAEEAEASSNANKEVDASETADNGSAQKNDPAAELAKAAVPAEKAERKELEKDISAAAAAETAAVPKKSITDIRAYFEKRKSESKAVRSAGSDDGGDGPVKIKKHRRFWGAVKIFLALVIVGTVGGAAYAAYTIANAPTIHPEKLYDTLDVSTHIYDDDGKLIDDIYYSENRDIAKYEQFPDDLKNAFIAIEDKTFWTHNGFNFKRIFGAVYNSITGGGEISGTSTITQQLARNVFLPEEKSVRSIKRKIIEMYYAHEIEETMSKEEILTAYLNTIYLGYGCYGVDTAARKYFSKDVEDLSLEQCASLAALPQAPGVYALIVTEEGENTTKIKKGLYANDVSQERRYMVLDLMAEQGYITSDQARDAQKPVTDFIKPGSTSSSAQSAFKDYVIETVIADLMKQYDLTDEQATKMVYTKGLNIYSTLDSQAQKVITKEFKKDSNFPDSVKKGSPTEAAMVITEVGTGEIKAMVGGRKTNGEKLFNRANSPRQPGSSIKPLAVYAPALQKSYEYQKGGKRFPFKDTGYDSQGKRNWGNYITAMSTVTDEKMVVNGNVWPLNFSRTYTGYKNFRTAIQQSINTCAVKILAQIGVEYSMDTVKKFGITTAVDDTSEPYNDVNLAALGLGAMTEGVTPLEMSLAFATFPNGGVRNSGICYTKVTDSDGKVLLEGKSEKTKVLNEGVAFIMTDVLQTVVSNGIAYDAAISGERVGGKTGTTNDTYDIWFDGFTPKYAASLWIGTDDNTTLDATSMRAAALWSKIMKQVKGAKGGTYKSRPSNVIVKNGEYYTRGTEPPDPVVVKKDKKTDEKDDKDKKSSDTDDSKASSDSKKKSD